MLWFQLQLAFDHDSINYVVFHTMNQEDYYCGLIMTFGFQLQIQTILAKMQFLKCMGKLMVMLFLSIQIYPISFELSTTTQFSSSSM